MDITEIVKNAVIGLRIQSKNWTNDWLEFTGKGWINSTGRGGFDPIRDFWATDWIIIKNPMQKTSFFRAWQHLIEGKKVRREGWGKGSFLQIINDEVRDENNVLFEPTYYQYIAKDWMVYVETAALKDLSKKVKVGDKLRRLGNEKYILIGKEGIRFDNYKGLTLDDICADDWFIS